MRMSASLLGPEGLAREQLPVAAALLPHQQEPDLDRRGLAAALADPRHVRAHDGEVADDLRRHLRELDLAQDALPGDERLDELRLVLDSAGRMAIVQLGPG